MSKQLRVWDPDRGRMVGDWGNPRMETRALLKDALERTEDPEARFHIRQAMQILHDEQSETVDA